MNQRNGEVLSEHWKKSNAEEAGRKEAIKHEAEHVIHNRDGQIAKRNSFGNDPRDRKG